MARKILTFKETYDVIAPYLDDYLDCVQKGFSDYVKINEFKNSLDVYSEFEIRTRASVIHDRICGRLADKFGHSPEIKVGKWNQVFALKFADLIFLRNKKFRKGGKVSSYHTPQHKSFLKQALIEGLPDDPTFVIGGYIPNDTYTELKGIYLGCWGVDGLEWFTKVGEYVVEQAKIIFPEFTEEAITKKRTKVKEVSENPVKKKRTKVKGKPKTGEDEQTGTGNA
ncbi:MAG: hypothetical protein ACR2FN_15320 [Chitinophagaceae bacterium]